MNSVSEWHRLKAQLRELNYHRYGFENQFYSRLLLVLDDDASSSGDRLLAFRDALLAHPSSEGAVLPSGTTIDPKSADAVQFGLKIDRSGNISLLEGAVPSDIDLAPVYGLERRRFIHEEMMDPSLQARLNNSKFKTYNGKAQKLAVRLALTSERQNTLLVNLPTGCGKTLVAHALSLFSGANQLTLVIVPTISLAVEQGARAAKMLGDANLGHGGLYYWHGGQSKDKHDDIKKRIRERTQRILFCSPEAACRSLLPTLFEAAIAGSLCNIVVDEAHIVDQWGAEFRPYFQILASLVSSLRKSSARGIKCVLMSATFSRKSLDLVQGLFGLDGKPCIDVNGSFLRPEIQYSVKEVPQGEHLDAVVESAIVLPKPLIVYVNIPSHADAVCSAIRRTGISRVAAFTGQTSTDRREELLGKWNESKLDVMVATSAFGLGMDKADVRSVLHATVPENLDRFYQEVGRGGRDGLVSQSLLLYHSAQIGEAKALNRLRLITPELGLEKWRTMWEFGRSISGGRRKVQVGAIRSDQLQPTEGNEEWNWRTLLLMQRVGLISIEIEKPSPPEATAEQGSHEYRSTMRDYYNKFYAEVAVTPLNDNHLEPDIWAGATAERRDYEKQEQARGLDLLLGWINSYQTNPLCELLGEYYKISGLQPEHACAGCPGCRGLQRVPNYPTLGTLADVQGVIVSTKWKRPFLGRDLNQKVYYGGGGKSDKRLLRSWVGWISRLIDEGAVLQLCANEKVLEILDAELRNKTEAFWMGELIDRLPRAAQYWPREVLHLDKFGPIPDLGWGEVPTIIIAPEELPSPSHPYRKWWEADKSSVSLDNFLHRMNYVDN